ncbi:MAG: hypothetical protein NT040_01895 [Bacteroidetes bacterium]|nr:hypothetical protein [Bacteroidota bacterium]
MKTSILISFFFLAVVLAARAQGDPLFPQKLYKTRITLTGEKRKITGIIYDIRYTSVMVSYSTNKKDYFDSVFDYTTLDARMIDKITIRTGFKSWEGTKIAFYTGFVLGGAAGVYDFLVCGNSYEYIAGEALLGGILTAGIGALIGAMIPVKINISINGNLRKFEQQKSLLKTYSVR